MADLKTSNCAVFAFYVGSELWDLIYLHVLLFCEAEYGRSVSLSFDIDILHSCSG